VMEHRGIWWRMGSVACLCVTLNVACSQTSVQPYMNSRMGPPLMVPEGLSVPHTSDEMDVPEDILARGSPEGKTDIPRSGDGEALPPGLAP